MVKLVVAIDPANDEAEDLKMDDPREDPEYSLCCSVHSSAPTVSCPYDDQSDGASTGTVSETPPYREQGLAFPLPRDAFFDLADLLTSNSTERQGFILFVQGGLWKAYVSPVLLSSLLKASAGLQVWGTSANSNESSWLADMPESARQVCENELSTDGVLNMDRARIEDCFTSQELRSLTVAVLVMCYLDYRQDNDADLIVGFKGVQSMSYYSLSTASYPCPYTNSLTLTATASQSQSQATVPYPSCSPKEEDSSFFIDPVSVLQVTARATAPHEFIALLSEGAWVSDIFSVCDHLNLSLSISTVVQASSGRALYPLCYGNRCFVRNYGERTAPVFQPAHWLSKDDEDVYAAWQQGLATKSKLYRKRGPPDAQLACCLPVMDSAGKLKYVIAIHQEIAKSSALQAMLRLSDFLLYTVAAVIQR